MEKVVKPGSRYLEINYEPVMIRRQINQFFLNDFYFHFGSYNVEAAAKPDVMVVSDFRRALPQFMVVAVKNLILLGEDDDGAQ